MASIISAGTTSGTAIAVSGDTTGDLAFTTQAGVNTITVPNVTGTLALTSNSQFCQAYVNFYSNGGASAVIQKSFYVSSCTRAAAGTWYVNYTNALSSVNCVTGSTGAMVSASPNAQTTSNNSGLRCLVVLSNNSTGVAIASPYVNGTAPIDDTWGQYSVVVF